MYVINISKELPDMVQTVKKILDDKKIPHTFTQKVLYSSSSSRTSTDCCFRIEEDENIREDLNRVFDSFLEKTSLDINKDITTCISIEAREDPGKTLEI